MELVEETYRLTQAFPRQETYGLTIQMRRSAVSVPANISEGHTRPTRQDFVRFLTIAKGSLRELETYCEVSAMLRYADERQLKRIRSLAEETGKMLRALCAALPHKKTIRPGRRSTTPNT